MYTTSGGETYLYKFGIASGRDSDDTAGGMAQGTVSLATGDASAVYVTAWDMLYRYCTVNVDDVTGFVADETVTLKDSDGANTKQAKVKYIDSSGDKLILDRESYGLRWLRNYKGGTVTLDSNTSVTATIDSSDAGNNNGTDIDATRIATYGVKDLVVRAGWGYPSQLYAGSSGYRSLGQATGNGSITFRDSGGTGVGWDVNTIYIPDPPNELVVWLVFDSGEHFAEVDIHVGKVLGSKTPIKYDPVN